LPFFVPENKGERNNKNVTWISSFLLPLPKTGFLRPAFFPFLFFSKTKKRRIKKQGEGKPSLGLWDLIIFRPGLFIPSYFQEKKTKGKKMGRKMIPKTRAKEKMTNEKTSARKRLTTVSQSLIGRGFFSLSFRWSFLGERSRRGLLSHHHFS